ncbi:PAAR domain-containing protein [Klebsiella michiganensis]|uniref:PAAR domain-containing protein n=1 Tax=Klebsiella michiganensis TaxID=1134687 RepID=UPI001F348B46|nr:PAAR domain-containing protein [Klebsiella michiganensis]MDQ2146614.1 PAAR domain-containing protein [Klebsiella michiganensis]MDS7802574.1 PAAR domain-containing protein [Klebsiella michiganensis]MDV6974049.1 PAAR domain-containing protein [Klebsiella michiganensis]MDW5483773.1 PAAR domain-containing protein [Klebsiella michiganensis]MDW5497641.1 PAAR domain-containing protein [Klebsiella michiganensis]
MASVNRGCTVHGKNVGLHGDKTSTGSECIATRTGFTVMGKLKLYIGDKTTPCPKCGKVGVIVTGDHRQTNGVAVAVDGAEILCGCPQGTNFLIAPGTVEVNTPSWAIAPVEPLQHAQVAKKQNSFADTCKPEDNQLLNGVYLWTETTSAGHAFVSVHENNSIYLYTYGRYGRTDKSTFTGDGILDFFQDEDAHKYYRYELYEMGARAFRIDDADPKITRKFFENLWNGGVAPIQTPSMQDGTKRRGRTIDKYDVTGSNCTTHSVEGIKFAGSKLFDHGYTSTTTQLPIEIEEDFTIPVSLQSYLESKSADFSSMLVVEMTNTFKQQYPNTENKIPQPMGGSAKIQQAAADSAAVAGSTSPYSGGTVGGSLGSTYDDE